MSIRRNHYLEQRVYRWYYVRRVPSRYQVIDTRRTIKVALHTDSLIIARKRRDAMMDADEHFWETTLAKKTSTQPEETPEMCRYRSARRRAPPRLDDWLQTDSLIIARERRDIRMDADEHFWEAPLVKQTSTQPEESLEMCRYRTARRPCACGRL